jgi:RNA polymerase sigma-70 factor (ECF subfamily)
MMAESLRSLVLESREPVSDIVPTTHDIGSLVEEHTDFVFRSLRRAGLDVGAAEDAAQQVFLIASRRIALRKLAAGKEKAFLYATARNVAAELRRRVSKRREVELVEEDGNESTFASVSPASSPDEMIDRRRARALLDEALASMPEQLRDVFVLSELEELSAPEVAACIDVPVGTVALRLSRARHVFDECLARVQARRAFRRPL